MSRTRTVATAGALGVLSFALYLPSLTFGFIRYDDQTVLLGHPALYDHHSFLSSVREIFTYLPREEPLLVRDLSWAFDSRVFGFDNPLGYHLGNVLLNALNAALLFLFLLHATRRYGFSMTVAALWACLPLHVEPVAWVMGRKDLLAATCSLAMFILQSVALRLSDGGDSAHPPERRARLANLGVLVLYPFAVLSKFSAVAMVLALAVQRTFYAYVSGNLAASAPLDARRALHRVRGLWPHALLSAALYAWYSHQVAAFGVTARGPSPLDLRHLALVAARVPLVLVTYVRNVLSPARLSIFYDWPSAGIALTHADEALSIAVAAATLGLGAWAARLRKDLLFFGLVGFALMATYLNIVYVGIWVADRYVYLSSFCALAVVIGLAEGGLSTLARTGAPPWILSWSRSFLVASAVAVLVVSAADTRAYEATFHDPLSFWSYQASRPEPSMLALEGHAKTLVVLAESTPDEAARAPLVDAALAALSQATDHYRKARWEPVGRYIVDAHAEYASVIVLRGRVAALAGEPDEVQLGYYRQAIAFSGTWVAAMLMERILYRQADEQNDAARAREAFFYFQRVVLALAHDPARRDALRERLESGYRLRFPFLGPSVDGLEKSALR